MKRGGIEGPVGPLLVLLALIFGLVAYLAIGNQHGNLEHEMEEYSPVSTENLMSSGFHEDYGTHESTESQQEEMSKDELMQDFNGRIFTVLGLQPIE